MPLCHPDRCVAAAPEAWRTIINQATCSPGAEAATATTSHAVQAIWRRSERLGLTVIYLLDDNVIADSLALARHSIDVYYQLLFDAFPALQVTLGQVPGAIATGGKTGRVEDDDVLAAASAAAMAYRPKAPCIVAARTDLLDTCADVLLTSSGKLLVPLDIGAALQLLRGRIDPTAV